MTKEMYEIKCETKGADYHFMVRSSDKDEVAKMAMMHAEKVHSMEHTPEFEKQSYGMIKTVKM